MNKIYRWQHNLWQKLLHNCQSGAHALLLQGREGIGKFDFALNLANYLLCENPSPNGTACGICLSCHWFMQHSHPDFYLVTPETSSSQSDAAANENDDSITAAKSKKKNNPQIGVAQIRALSDFVYTTGHQQGQRIVVIHPAETMNAAAANALLKKLEEPPLHVLFILVSHRPQRLPATIRSRCQLINMPMPDSAQAIQWLKQQGVDQPEVCLAAASFAPLLALKLNQQNYMAQYNVFIEQISDPQHINPIALAEKMQQADLPTVVSWMQKWCYDLLNFSLTGKIRYHVSRQKSIQALSLAIDVRALVTFLRSLSSAQQVARHPLNTRLFLEEILFSYQMLLEQ